MGMDTPLPQVKAPLQSYTLPWCCRLRTKAVTSCLTATAYSSPCRRIPVCIYSSSTSMIWRAAEPVTLFDDEEVMNVIATEGAVEITSVTDTHVTGRIDARADEDNFISGNFTVALCQ